MRGFLVKLRDYNGSDDFVEAYYLIVSSDAKSLQEEVKQLIKQTKLNLLSVQEIDINNHNIVLLCQDFS